MRIISCIYLSWSNFTYIHIFYIYICKFGFLVKKSFELWIFNKNNKYWPLHCVSWINSNLQMAAIYLDFQKKGKKYIYQSKNKTISKVIIDVQSKIQTYSWNKVFNISYHFTIYSYRMIVSLWQSDYRWLIFQVFQSKFFLMSTFRDELIVGK